jgi:pimeloyl-ACP methyl ester carboxylesterase
VTPAYGRAFGALIPGSRFALIEAAGHHPEIEQPQSLVDEVIGFLDR